MLPTDRQYLPRPRLERQFDQILQFPLTVIRASMGFGKTTAIREYLRMRGVGAIYLPLMGADGALGYCWERLSAHVEKRSPELGSQLRALGFPANGAQTARMMDLLSGSAPREPLLVVIDDYHLIECRQAADFITLLAGEGIPRLHVVLLARETPCLPVDDLRQKGLCCVISQEDLQFQPDETADYFRMLGVEISEAEIDRVAAWTGGWISGIYLIARGFQNGVTQVWPASLDRLLELNFYSAYEESTRLFLEQLSFFDAFTPEQVAYVWEDSSAPRLLFSLIQGNAFISFNRSAGTYQMVQLLRDFLRRKAAQRSYDPTTLYRRMGAWYLARGELIPAFDYLYRAGDTDAILSTLNQEEAPDVKSTQFDQIAGIFRGLPESMYVQYPLAALQYVRVSALTCLRPEAERLDRLLARLEQFFLSEDLEETYRSRVLGEIHNVWLLVAFNNPQAMVEHAEKAVRYFAGRYSCLISSETEFTFGAVSLLYAYYSRPGGLRETVDFISGHFHILGQAVKGCGWGSESLILAEYALETGDFDAVPLHACKAVYQARLYRQADIELCAVFTLCRLAVYQGRLDEAGRLLAQLGALTGQKHSSVLNTTAALCTAYIDCCLRRPERVPAWLRERDGGGSFLYAGLGFPHVVTGFTALLSREYIQLEILCDAFEQDWHLYENQLGLIAGGICRAGARTALYGPEEGARALMAALDIAVKDGVVFPFAEQFEAVQPLLSQPCLRRRYPAAFLDRVAACCRTYGEALEKEGSRHSLLTERELEILVQLSRGKRHSEIAASLYISVPTVRYHLQNVYRKLDVNNKLAALARARELGLPL